MTKYETRYQDSPWYVKMYRWLRHKPGVPYYAFRGWWGSRKLPEVDDEGYPRLTWSNYWGIAQGITSAEMNHLYTCEEVFGRLGEKLGSND